jgi:predicted PurR-regulated permease PerM
MTNPDSSRAPALDDRSFLFVDVLVTVAFVWILLPFYGAILWGVIFAVVFRGLYRRVLLDMPHRPSIAAVTTLLVIVVMVIIPISLVGSLLVQEAVGTYERIQSGELNVVRFFEQVRAALPGWADRLLDRVGLDTLGAVGERLSTVLTRSAQFIAAQALNIGQNALDFVISLTIMLYLLFFLLRDGERLARRIRQAVPLRAEQQRNLADRFNVVIRATIKGNLVVALAQGALGGLIFWVLGVHAPILWGTLMAFLSLLPAVGAGVVWVPVAIYFIATGEAGKGIILILFGVLVIGLVDNFLRPILVGKDTKMPDYVVLISTLGGIAVFGLNGFVLGPLIAALFITVWDIVTTSRATPP